MIVIDASVAIKWVEIEEDSQQALNIQKAHLMKLDDIIVPQLLYYEVANTFATKSFTSEKYIKLGLSVIYDSRLNIKEIDKDDLYKASKLAKKFKTSVYDMIYAVIAKKHKTILVTADEKFIGKTKFPFVKLLNEYTARTKI